MTDIFLPRCNVDPHCICAHYVVSSKLRIAHVVETFILWFISFSFLLIVS